MKLGRLLIAAILLAGLAGGLWWSNKTEKDKEGKPAAGASPKILTLAEADIRQIEIKHRNGEDTVVKKTDAGAWAITAPKPVAVDQTAVSAITGAANTGLPSERVVDDNATDLASYGLAPPVVETTFTMKDGKTTKVLFGEETPAGGQVYAKLDGDPRLFTVAIFNKNNFDKDSKALRDKQLMTFAQDKVSRVELTTKKGGSQAVEFGRVGQNEWQILKPKPLRADGLQVDELVRKVKDAAMDPSVSDDDAKKAVTEFNSAPVQGIVKVTDPSGTQTLEIRKSKDDYYAKSSVVDGIYKVMKDLGDGLDKSMDDFRNKKLFDFGFNQPTRVELKDGAKDLVFEKTGDKWMSAGKAMDSTGVQAFIDKVRDLSASKFLDTGFTTSVVEVSVVSNDGKRTEKVQISQPSPAIFIAKRENEPGLYALDVNSVQELRLAATDVKEAAATPAKK